VLSPRSDIPRFDLSAIPSSVTTFLLYLYYKNRTVWFYVCVTSAKRDTQREARYTGHNHAKHDSGSCFIMAEYQHLFNDNDNYNSSNIIIMIMTRMIFMEMSSQLTATVRVHPLHLMNADWVPRGCQVHSYAAAIHVTTIYYYLNPKADIHCTVPWRMDGWVDLGAAGK